jgi:hypothetical protein
VPSIGPVLKRLVFSIEATGRLRGGMRGISFHSADLGRTLECFTDMTNSRMLGFAAYRQTTRSFFDVFDDLRARRIIPS